MKNPKTEEKKYEQLRKLGQELHIPVPEHFIELEVTDKNGKVLQTLKQRSHSWVRNAYNMLLSQMASKNMDDAGSFGAGFLSIKDTAANIQNGNIGAYVGSSGSSSAVNLESSVAFRAGAGVVTHGIVVGSNAGAWTFEQYVLLTPIAEGVGADQLNYIAMSVPTKSYAALTWTITWVRYMNNNSGGNISVNEVCIIALGSAGTLQKYILFSRDVLGAPVVIPDTGQLKVTYTIQLAYPA